MIINKSSYERGFGHGTVYKTVLCKTQEIGMKSTTAGRSYFCNTNKQTAKLDNNHNPVRSKWVDELDYDGLP